ncbi:hypothetical protein L6452_13571 [Arctium lappa]|uniref:Uncharacterized protein n=1 Tax=Arctium lappa TaxID=4217 RepID=A0ACB9CIG5_ARCLA|nr:hypothetical protein L6452_13571 [Arctium lappa]
MMILLLLLIPGPSCGRHRWVEYAAKGHYNASQVPAEWHGWLHFVTDYTGDQLLMLKPKRYGLAHKENFTGEEFTTESQVLATLLSCEFLNNSLADRNNLQAN